MFSILDVFKLVWVLIKTYNIYSFSKASVMDVFKVSVTDVFIFGRFQIDFGFDIDLQYLIIS